MGRNSTLGDFAGSGNDEPTPIEAVHRWSPDPIDCPRCGDAVQGRWLGEGTVGRCTDCKEW